MQAPKWLTSKRVCLISAVFLISTATNAYAQLPRDKRPEPWTDGKPPKSKPGEVGDRVLEEDRAAMEKNSKRVNRGSDSKPIAGGTEQLTPAQKKLLSPADADLVKFDKFLKGAETGILRLFPKGRFEYALNRTISVDATTILTLPITGGAAAYSFTRRRHELTEWTEIGLQDKKLFSGMAGSALGFMANLGDIPIEDVSLRAPTVQILQNIAAPKTRAEAIEQSHRNSLGYSVGGVTFYSVLPVKAGSTYAMRSIAEGRADIVIAFRVDRQEDDGSLLILWKRLKKASAPILK